MVPGYRTGTPSARLISDEAKRRTSLDIFRPMGRIVLSGRATPIVVWEPAREMDEAVRSEIGRLWAAFDAGDKTDAGRATADDHDVRTDGWAPVLIVHCLFLMAARKDSRVYCAQLLSTAPQ